MMETLAVMFKKLRKEIKTKFIRAKIHSEEEPKEWQRKINSIELWDMRYQKNYIVEFGQY